MTAGGGVRPIGWRRALAWTALAMWGPCLLLPGYAWFADPEGLPAALRLLPVLPGLYGLLLPGIPGGGEGYLVCAAACLLELLLAAAAVRHLPDGRGFVLLAVAGLSATEVYYLVALGHLL